jgi:hypothetical protein
MPKQIVVASLVLLVGLSQAVTTSASVIYTSRTSTLSLSQCQIGGSCTTQTQSVSDFSPLAATLTASGGDSTSVSQQSQLATNSISVNLSAFKTGVDFDSTSFKVDFTLDTATNVTLSGYDSYLYGGTTSSIALTGSSGSVFGIADVTCGMSGPYSSCTYSNETVLPPPYSTKSLAPGAYELYLTAEGYGEPYMGNGVVGDANFTVSFAPVPIPAAGWLLSSALGGLAWLTRRRKTRGGPYKINRISCGPA